MKPLSSPLQQYWQTVVERLPEPLAEESLSAQAKSVLTFSDFVQDSVIAHPKWLTELESQPPQADEWQHYAAWLQEALSNVSDEAGLMRELRLFRRRIMVRIAWAQTLALVTEESILQQLSHLAETLIVAARDWLYDACCREWGTPCNAQGEAQPLLILGMGKLGGGELNFSSDIDLIFAWPEHGCTQGGRRELDNAQFFTRMGQRLIKVLDQPTQDGFVYRVDMRLRPFGESGPLVLSFAALEDYYQEQGRDWERYAMVKARIMGDSDGVYANELRAMLRPFVFRRYIDFSVIQSLRNMKGMIAREVRRRGLTDNIKLGAGGIREIEFIVQVFQLIRGGREPSLQSRALLPTLSAIAALHLLSENDAEQLRVAYLFLRRLENLLQSINDEQTQTLPSDELNRARLAWAMDFADWPQLTGVLTAHMANVRRVFNELIGDDESETQEESLSEQWRELWQDALQEDDTTPVLAHLSEDDRKQVLMLIADFRKELDKRTIGPRGRQVLDHLMPHLLSDVCAREDAAVTLSRITALLVGIVTRTTYLELLSEFPEIDALFGVPAPARWHPEIDTGIHTLMTLSMAAMLSPQVDVRFATLCHDLGKGLTPPELWPRHHGHGPAGVKLVEQLCQRLRVPNEIRDLARLVAEFHDLIHTFPMLNPKTIVKLFDSIDAWRKPQRVEQLALTSEADVRGRTGFESADYPQGRWLREAWEVAQSVPTKAVVEAGFKGVEIRGELTRRRIAAVAGWKEQRCPKPD